MFGQKNGKYGVEFTVEVSVLVEEDDGGVGKDKVSLGKGVDFNEMNKQLHVRDRGVDVTFKMVRP